MDLHPGEEIVFSGHPSWRATLGSYLIGLLGAIAIGVLAGIVLSTGAGVLVWLVLLVIVLAAGFIQRAQTRYTITNQRLHIRRGLLSKAIQQTRIDRVQNVNTRQSLLERLLRVGTVDFDTAGSDDSEFAFAGIAEPQEVVNAVDRAQRAAAAATPGAPGV